MSDKPNLGPKPLTHYDPPKGPLTILHADAALIAVDKPAGLLSVPGKDPAFADCVEARLREVDPEARLVHRLDMDTSGVMIFARTQAAQRHLGLQFERRHLKKTYEARVTGCPNGTEGVIDLPLIADWPNRPLQKVCHATGKPARTGWQVLKQGRGEARLALYPETGRSHQLRVHLKEIGHPIIGDRFYGTMPSERMMLHATRLSLRHPEGGAWLEIVSPAPF